MSAGPDLILHGGRIYTVDRDDRVVEAIAIHGGRIVAVGGTDEVRRLAEIQEIFRRMYRHLLEPRFRVTERVVGPEAVVLAWNFEFRMRAWRPAVRRQIHGLTLLRFDAAGKVNYHRDYWDAAEELYEKLPGVGALMRGLRRCAR